jgi:hypothetical protein
MTIRLSAAQIEQALPRIAPGLKQYLWLQEQRDLRNLRTDAEYRRRFNLFYRVRRGKQWQDDFYALLEQNKQLAVTFGEILQALHRATGRFEASFASKLVATARPEMPVIDSVVLRNLNLRLPTYGASDRAAKIVQLYATLASRFGAFLMTENGRQVVQRFRDKYPEAKVSEVKMLDLVLWQTRSHVPAATLHKIERHFHAVIRARAAEFSVEPDVPLPSLAPLLAQTEPKAWFPIDGMYGGFSYWLRGRGRHAKLVVESWCRVIGGSGKRHEITAEGSKLVEEGFV